MWKWGTGDDSSPKAVAHGSQDAANMSVADLTEQLTRTEQLVTQLKELIREKDNELRNRDNQLKEEKEASEAKFSKIKLQNKAKVTSLTSQLEELKKQLSGSEGQEKKAEQTKRVSRDGDQENAAANRGKLLVLRRRVEELEFQNAHKNEELQKKIAELEAQRQRGAEMDAMLAEKEKKLAEKEAYIIDLQLACDSSNVAKETLTPSEELKNQLSMKESSLQSMQILVQSLTKKVGDSEERCSLLQEQIESLKNLQSKERDHFQEREAMYIENIRMFQNIIQEKEKELVGQAQKHEQELFKLIAKSDASADLEQLLKALKQKLHEKEEVMLGRTQVIVMLQKELDGKDQLLKEINENLKRLQSEKENLQSKLDAEKHVMRAQLRDMMEKHELEMMKVQEKHNAEVHEIQEKHETELQEKDQALLQLQKQVAELRNNGQSNSEQAIDVDTVTKQKMEQLEAQVKLKTEEASKSEAKFLKMKAWSKSKIKQLEDELKSVCLSSKNDDISALNNCISELEIEKKELQSKLKAFSELRTQNEELLAKLEVYEEQQRKLQADLEQVTKRATSQASESGSVDEFQSQLLEWQEIVPESEEVHDQVREEKSAIALRMAQIEEEREAIVSGQQELEEELTAVQRTGRLQQARRKSNQASGKHQEEYNFDRKECFQELNVTLDSTDSAEGENMGGWWPEYASPNAGLRTVVEELELERNQLQEQILFLEERCQDLEDRLQLQGRMESLQVTFGVEEEGQPLRVVQSENERLQTQLSQLRTQQMRDAEKHQVLVSSLNEQLKGLSDRKSFLETSLAEKEQKLLSTTEKLEQIENLRKLLQEKDLLNKELGEKLVQTEQKLDEVLKKYNAYEVECTEQKIAINDLTEKVATFKEKTLKQDAMVELMQLELDQTNEELDRLNTNHLEERSQLIQDLQRREREIDNLKEVLVEKDKEISALSSNMTEYSEQIVILKHQIQCKEEEIREMEEALTKAERETHLLKEVQTADIRDTSMKISVLSEQINIMGLELEKSKSQTEAITKENEELIRQISENSITIKDLRSEIKSNKVTYHNKLMECESQITLLKEQINKTLEKLQETEAKHREETKYLKLQLDENNSIKEKLKSLLKEKENKEQSFEKELKSFKDLYNKLVLEAANKDEELAKLSTQLAEHIEHQETVKKVLQEKLETITSLEQKLQIVKQQSEETKHKLIGDLKAKEMQFEELKNHVTERQEIVSKMEADTQTIILINKQLQAALEGKEKDLSEQIKGNEDLRNIIDAMQKEKQQLVSENESLLDMKERELLKRNKAVAEMENKISVSEIEYQKTLSELNYDKEVLMKKVEQLSTLVEQKENSVTEQLLEKTKECNVLTNQQSESRELTQQLNEQIQSFIIQLKNAEDREVEKEEMLNNKLTECNTLLQQLSQSEEKILLLQKQIQDITVDFQAKEEQILHNVSLRKQVEENKVDMEKLQNEVQKLKEANIKLSQSLEERALIIKNQDVELENLHKQVAEKTEKSAMLNKQVELLRKEGDVLKHEKKDISVICSKKSSECADLQSQLTQHQSEIVSVKHQAHILNLENEKLKVDVETVNATVMKKSDEITALTSHMSQQDYNILALKHQTDSLTIENEKLKIGVEEKEALLSEKEALIQQMKENKVAGEGQHLKIISDLQNQVQALSSETSQLRQAAQEKENEFKKQAQDLKLFKDKSEESDLLRFQLSENMEIISDLQCQLKNMMEKTAELNQSVIQKDESLKQKIDEYVNLKAHISEIQESSCMQQKQFESLTSEVERLKTIVLEKELAVNNAILVNDKLKTDLHDKERECEVLKNQVTDLEEATLKLEKEINDQKKVINDISQSMLEKESSLVEKTSLLKKLSDKASEDEDKIQLVSQLQSQMHELTQEIQKSKELEQEKENAFLSLQEKIAAQYEQRNALNVSLSKKEEVIAGLLNSLNEKDVSIQLAESNICALTNEIEMLREELEKSAAAVKSLTSVLQEKDDNFAINQKKFDSLTVELDSVKREHQKAQDQINIWKQDTQQKELTLQTLYMQCTEQAKNIEHLKSELNNVHSKSSQDCRDSALLIERLQQQVDSLAKEKILLQETIDKLIVENKDLITYQNQLQQKTEEIHEKLEVTENYSRMQIDAVKLKMKNEKEQLQMQVSVKGEEVSELKLKIEKLEQSLIESENKWVTEFDRATQQNSVLKEKLSSLESEMKPKDSKIQSLQQELDVIKEELTESLSALLSSRHFFKEKDAETSDVGQQVSSKTKLEKFSAMVSTILSKETEGQEFQLLFLEKEKEMDIIKDKLKSMHSIEKEKELLQNDLEKVKNTCHYEIECLSEEMATVKDTLYKQQSLVEEREKLLAEMNKEVNLLQEKLHKSEKELKISHEKLNMEGKKIVSLLEEMEKKDLRVENLTSQTDQQNDIISALNQQLKEKDCFVAQIMESMSNEMMKFSEERSILNTKLQHLEAVQSSSVENIDRVSQQLEDCKTELQHNQVKLSNKETAFKDLMSEKEQLQFNLEKLVKEKEILKKKLQAALIIRKDLMQKIGKLERIGQEETEKEHKKTEELLKRVDALTHQLKLVETQNKDLESHLETLKQQLFEKDSKINNVNESFSAKVTSLEQLEDIVAKLKDILAEKEKVSEQNLKSMQEKDSMLAHMQSVLSEKEREYGEERSQLLATLENLKAEIVDEEELLKDTNLVESYAGDIGNNSVDFNNKVTQPDQLEGDKEILQKKLQASLLTWKENIKKLQREKKECAKLVAEFDEQTKDFELLKREHRALQKVHLRKCKEFDCNRLLIYSLQKELESHVAALQEQKTIVQNKLESDEQKYEVQDVLGESEQAVFKMTMKDSELEKLSNDYAKLCEETKKLKDELRETSVELGKKTQETVDLKNCMSQLEQHYEQHKDSLYVEIGQLREKLEKSETEVMDLKTMIESMNNEKETVIKKRVEDCKTIQKGSEKLKVDLQQANIQVAERNEEIKDLHCTLMDFKDRFDQEKEIRKEAVQLQLSLQESQEEAKHFKMAFEDMKREREEFINSLEKSNEELLNMKKELKYFSKENKELLMELSMLREKAVEASEVSNTMVLCKKVKDENATDKELVQSHSEINLLQGRLQDRDICTQSLEHDHSGRAKLIEGTKYQIQKQTKTTPEQMEKNINVDEFQPQEQKNAVDEKSRERLQRKLQAALISRKEALKENKFLKDQIDRIMLEKEKLTNKAYTLECLLSELGREKQNSDTISSLCDETLVSENARLLTENENLTAACESLKSTMETIVQEKEAFSFQLNTLKDSQTVELTGWKVKHNELKQEYESLLQAYENISSKVAEMRQVIDVTRKEKQEAIHRFSERESEKYELEKQLQEVINENKDIKNQLKQFAESKQLEIDELRSEAERQTRKHASRMEEHRHRLHEAALQSKQLMEENEQLKHTSENLKQALEKTENENEVLHNDMNVTKLALENLQVQMEVSQTDMQSKISDVLNERESLLKQIALLNDDISVKERNMRILEQERELILERIKETEEFLDQKNNCLSKLENESRSLKQEIVSLNERVKILEDDKRLLQEELENVQETSYKVKNEREFLETELLNHIKNVDQLTDRLKSAQLQNSLLIQQLEDLKAEKCSVIREKEEQQLHLVKVFEEKVKCAQRDNSGTKNKTKELQELLKEKQQEINQLQKDSIKFQELILDLQRSVKLSQSKSEKFEKDLNNIPEKLAKSNEEIHNLNKKLSSQKALLDDSKSELERLTAENLSGKRELKKKEDQLQIQRREFEKELELGLEQLKTVHKREWLNLEERRNVLQREKDRAVSELHQLQEEINIKDSQNKKLQADLNATLARLAAFTKCMSSLQNDRDRVIGEMKTWEIQFKEVIQNKEKQMDDSSKKIMSLQEEMKDKVAQIQELKIKYSMLEDSKNEMHLRQKSVHTQHYSELGRIKEENVTLINRQQELEIALQSKEETLQALLKENNSLNRFIENSSDAGREIKALESNFARKEQELQQLLFEKEKTHAELEKQIAISQQMKVMLNNKDTEISLLISSKGGEISGYLTQIQTQHRKQTNEYEQQIRSLQKEREQSNEACQRMENELKNLQMKADKAIQDKAEIASEIDAFKKSMSSLQYDRDDLFSKYKDLEHHHQNVLSQKDSLLVNGASENGALKQQLRKLLNRIDDLHSENAMQSAQLIKYREDLNQVLSLKDHQLKELLKQQLDSIKNLEQEKMDLQKQIKEMQLINKLQKESTESLEHENQKLTSKVKDLEFLIASINKEKLVSESGEKPQTRGSGQHNQNKDFKASVQPCEKLQDKFQEVQNVVGKNTKDIEDKYSITAFEHDANFLWKEADASSEKRLLEAQFQNKKLKSQNESFGKAMTALQDDRDRLIEDFKVLQSKYTSELKSEKKRADELEADLNYFKSNLFSVLKKHDFLNPVLIGAENKITLDQFTDEIENLCKTLTTQDLEITRLSSECRNYVQQIDAFSKSMASLQDDRDRLLQELSKSKAKEGASLASVEIAKLKTKVDDLERALHQTKAFQEETEIQISSYQNELAGLRMEKNLLLTESQALRNQYEVAVADKDRQIAELQKLQHDMIVKESVSIGSHYPIKPLETATLVGGTNNPEQMKHLLAERSQFQNELQRCLQEMHQRELRFQQMNSKVIHSVEENAVLSAQLKAVSQTLRENQLRYTDLQNRYLRLEREYQTVQVSSFQDTAQGETRAEVPPGAPQERAAVIVEIDNMELNELRKRLAETQQQYDSMQQALLQLTETLSEERSRREAAEDALRLTEEQCKRLEMSSYRSVPREYTVQMESDEEREALIINPSEHIVVRKMKGGALSFKRWLRGRSLYCSKLLTSRAKSRYLFLTYLVTLHVVVFLCLTGIL
ncbi:golgin subfamily B member 1-like isoform X3 [Dermochelys coriacea]|uniref:golgin subfamily B member 1-like isoform X3 n=1 Tax=Dermochelys coriacea TaxID=27794 RepID=UPI001CA9A3B3|nr:golgin subfamily B member 1-like isoform X3 [Dermochelys coriacea]